MKKSNNKLNFFSIVLLSVCLSFLFSCDKKNVNSKFTEFPSEIAIKANPIPIKEVYQDGLFSFYDTLAILTRTLGNKHQIHIYNEDFRYISSSGLTGKGPGEITNPFFATTDQKKGILWFLDMGKKKIHKFPLDSLIKNADYLPVDSEAIPVPKEIPILLQFYPQDDEIFSCANYFSDSDLFSFFNMNGDVIDSLGIQKEELLLDLNSKDKRLPKVTFLYQKHPNQDLYVASYKYSDIVVIVNKEGKVIAMLQGPDMINQNPNALKENYKSAYDFVDCDKEFIYALYLGDYNVDEDMKPKYAQTIHVFNWEGEPVAKLNLDHPIGPFSIQNKYNKIISYSQSIGEFVSFSIPADLYEN